MTPRSPQTKVTQGRVHDVLDSQEDCLGRLASTVKVVEERLTHVVVERGPVETEPTGGSQPDVPLAERIIGHNTLVCAAADRLESLVERLEV